MKSRFKKAVLSLCVLSQLSLASCAPSSDKVQATYVSPLQYQGYSCSQIRQEMMIVARHVSEVSGTQDHQANNDSVAMGVGLVIFWPALFFLANKDQREELGRRLPSPKPDEGCNRTQHDRGSRLVEKNLFNSQDRHSVRGRSSRPANRETPHFEQRCYLYAD